LIKVLGGTSMAQSITEKKCSKCGEWKDRGEYIKDPQKKDGLYSSCKACYKISYKNNPRTEYKKEYHSKNRDTILVKKRKTYYENRDTLLDKLKAWHANNIEKEKEYRVKNKEKISLITKAWQAINTDRARNNLKNWRKNNPEKVSVQKNNRRARENNGGKITNEEWQEVLEKYGNKCLCCGRTDVRLTLDHVMPLSIGGLNVIENAQPLCKSCNSRKQAKHIDYRPQDSK
jgi:hypothetical protein